MVNRKLRWILPCSMALGGLVFAVPAPAAACGCFAPPDLSVPVVQAGERLLFSVKDGQVTAHIQVQYSGKPADFGWLLPLPAPPTTPTGEPGIDISTDELFQLLLSGTQPRYRPSFSSDCPGRSSSAPASGGGCGGGLATYDEAPKGGAMDRPREMGDGPLVIESSIGPYDYAVLKADSKDEMLRWLRDNRFVVPTGIDAALVPYIRPGAFLVALKLRAGQARGDLQPVVVRYKADLPMIPIILTQVGATPNMGVQVFLLGAGRGIPRNYYHVLLNEAQLNLYQGSTNYGLMVTRAVAEAKGRHAFVTEYAGPSSPVVGVLDRAGRFARVEGLAMHQGPVEYVKRALDPAADLVVTGLDGKRPVSALLPTILSRHVPRPQALAQAGVGLWDYYLRLGDYLIEDRKLNPARYADIEEALKAFDPAKVTAEITDRIVKPTLAGGALLREHGYLTRLYTTLSPEDMTLDPVFSYNRDLPPVGADRTVTMVQHCDRSTTVTTSLGDKYLLPAAATGFGWSGLGPPYARRIEVLSDVGPPRVEVDNAPPPFMEPPPEMAGPPPSSSKKLFGCTQAPGQGGSLGLVLGGLALLLLRRRRPAAQPVRSRRP